MTRMVGLDRFGLVKNDTVWECARSRDIAESLSHTIQSYTKNPVVSRGQKTKDQ